MLSFRIHGMETLAGPYSSWHDKAHLLKGKTAGWTKEDFEKAGFRMVPNSPVRKGSYIAKNVVLMPCFINTGAYIGSGTMMDTFSRAGSCCQIGKNCHISAGSGVGGVSWPSNLARSEEQERPEEKPAASGIAWPSSNHDPPVEE